MDARSDKPAIEPGFFQLDCSYFGGRCSGHGLESALRHSAGEISARLALGDEAASQLEQLALFLALSEFKINEPVLLVILFVQRLSAITGMCLALWASAPAFAKELMEDRQPFSRKHTECVILLHGLARTPASMKKMAKALQATGFETINEGYDSRHLTIEELSATVIPAGLIACDNMGASRVHFVTHSLGGILVRHYLSNNPIDNLGRVVMLGPPNQGSELVDALINAPGFEWINGPAGKQLGTGDNSLPRSLGRAEFELGIIAGDRSVNLINSTMITGEDDGKVSVASTRLEGMADFLVVHHTHPFIMKARDVIEQTIEFLQHGRFDHGQTETSE